MMDKEYLTQHTSSEFNRELEEVRNRVLEMGGLAEKQVSEALLALFEGDSGLASEVADADDQMNTLEVAIDKGAGKILARRQPAAFDLRMLLMVIKTITDLERIGDEAERIARMAASQAGSIQPKGLYTMVRNLGDHVRRMLHDALDAYARMDVIGAVKVIHENSKIKDEYDDAMEHLMNLMIEYPDSIRRILDVLWCARALERIGDHAKNISEYVVYMVKGEDVRHLTPKELEQRIRS